MCRKLVMAVSLFCSVVFNLQGVNAQQRINIPKLNDLVTVSSQKIAQGQFRQVLQLLEPYEFHYAGRVQYDYYFGVALLENKRFGEAILALERVVSLKPDCHGAKFEVARALFHSKEYVRSKSMFEDILAQSPPEKLKKVSIAYLRAIQKQEKQIKPVNEIQLSLLSGYDNNANSSTDQEFIEGVFLDEKNIKKGSYYWGVAVTDQFSTPIAPDWYWTAQGGLQFRKFSSAQFVNREYAFVGTGLSWQTDSHNVTSNLQYAATEIKGAPSVSLFDTTDLLQEVASLHVNYQYKTQSQAAWGVSGRFARSRHDDALKIRDMDQTFWTVSYKTQIGKSNRLTVKANWGDDAPKNPISIYEAERSGASVAYLHSIVNDLTLVANFDYQEVNYANNKPHIGQLRDDMVRHASIGLNKLFDDRWSLLSRLTYTHHESSVDLFNYYKSSVDFILSYRM